MINVQQSNVNYLTTFTISEVTNNVCLSHIKHLFDKRINICMENRNEFGDGADKEVSEVVEKICSFVDYITLCVSFV